MLDDMAKVRAKQSTTDFRKAWRKDVEASWIARQATPMLGAKAFEYADLSPRSWCSKRNRGFADIIRTPANSYGDVNTRKL